YEKIIKSEIYKKMQEKRENVYYRINNLINHGIITLNQDLENEMCINYDIKEVIVNILNATKSSIKKNINNN
ncbi:MAG: hypothetical protein MUP85_22390, partial [Candidatus Lokiarchaeota archaeon]|nr:hypothetical protein [Candidatus Lokiarchaeota archaeon]